MKFKDILGEVLPLAGQAIGTYFGGPVGGMIGRNLGRMGGNAIEGKKTMEGTGVESGMNLFSGKKKPTTTRASGNGFDMSQLSKMFSSAQSSGGNGFSFGG